MKNIVYPIGSILLVRGLDGENKKVMVSTYAIKNNKDNISYEYAGFEIPGGYDPNNIYFFNNVDIVAPIFMGYTCEENKDILKKISEHYEDDNTYYLPIGSVVSIDDDTKVMITGLCTLDLINDCIFDYSGEECETNKIHMFNREDIKQILFIGYQDDSYRKYDLFLQGVSKEFKGSEDIYKKMREFMVGEVENNE